MYMLFVIIVQQCWIQKAASSVYLSFAHSLSFLSAFSSQWTDKAKRKQERYSIAIVLQE